MENGTESQTGKKMTFHASERKGEGQSITHSIESNQDPLKRLWQLGRSQGSMGHPSTVIRTLATYQAPRRVYPNWSHLCYSENFLRIRCFSDSPSRAGTVEDNFPTPTRDKGQN